MKTICLIGVVVAKPEAAVAAETLWPRSDRPNRPTTSTAAARTDAAIAVVRREIIVAPFHPHLPTNAQRGHSISGRPPIFHSSRAVLKKSSRKVKGRLGEVRDGFTSGV